MIQRFVEAWDRQRHFVRSVFKERHPEDYKDVVNMVVAAIQKDFAEKNEPYSPREEMTAEIQGDDYQGVNTYVIRSGYDSYAWYVRVGYGSCSGCDTLCAIRDETYSSDDIPTDSQADQYLTLALHILQGIKPMEGSV